MDNETIVNELEGLKDLTNDIGKKMIERIQASIKASMSKAPATVTQEPVSKNVIVQEPVKVEKPIPEPKKIEEPKKKRAYKKRT